MCRYQIQTIPETGGNTVAFCHTNNPSCIDVVKFENEKYQFCFKWSAGTQIDWIDQDQISLGKNLTKATLSGKRGIADSICYMLCNHSEDTYKNLFTLLTGISTPITDTPIIRIAFNPEGGQNGEWKAKNVGNKGLNGHFQKACENFATAATAATTTTASLSGEAFEEWLKANLSKLATPINSDFPDNWDHVGSDAIDISNPPPFTWVSVQGTKIDDRNDFWDDKGTCDFASPAGVTPSSGYDHFIEAKVASSNRVNITPHSHALIKAALNKDKHPWIIIAFDTTATDPTKILGLKPDTVNEIWDKAKTSPHGRLVEKACYTLEFGGAISSPPGKRTFGLSGGIEYELVFTRPVGAPCFEYPNPGGPIKVFVR